jgi:hypothetical protein
MNYLFASLAALAVAAVMLAVLAPVFHPAIPACDSCTWAARDVVFDVSPRPHAESGLSRVYYAQIYVDGKPLTGRTYCERAWAVVAGGVAYVSCKGAPVIPLSVAKASGTVTFTNSFLCKSGGAKLSGFNELNGWIAAWNCDNNTGIVLAVRPGILVPDSTGTGTGPYYVEVNATVARLSVVENTEVSVSGEMPSFMDRLEVRVGPYVVYKNGAGASVNIPPGKYDVTIYARAKRDAAPGSQAELTLDYGLSVPITIRIPQWSQWGIRVDVYSGTNFNTYKGTWSVGGVFFWLGTANTLLSLSGPYTTNAALWDYAPKWTAALLNPYATTWTYWSLKYSGRLYLPWSSFRVGVWHDDGVRVFVCGSKVVEYWDYAGPRYDGGSGSCPAAGVQNMVIEMFEGRGTTTLVFLVGPTDRSVAYFPTIDGAWYCDNFDWSSGKCGGTWSFVPAGNGVPYFVVDSYTPGGSDGGGTPSP